jgi:RNA-directed DNA polymerase
VTINIRGSNTGESVAQATKQTGETADRWSWVEPSVWTPRMLSALEQGVKGGKWFSLIDKVYATANLAQAYHRVAANGGAAGVDHRQCRCTNDS